MTVKLQFLPTEALYLDTRPSVMLGARAEGKARINTQAKSMSKTIRLQFLFPKVSIEANEVSIYSIQGRREQVRAPGFAPEAGPLSLGHALLCTFKTQHTLFLAGPRDPGPPGNYPGYPPSLRS